MRKSAVFRLRALSAFVLAVAPVLAGVGASYLWAEGESVTVVKVEEQWELVVAEPESGRGAPQVTAVLSPLSNLDGLYAAFELNHQSQPAYVDGGLQLQVWNASDVPLATRTQKDGQTLASAGETVAWTQSMAIENGQLTFDVDGASATWGNFGCTLHATVATSLASLNAYNPLVSVNNSGVGFASHRVSSLKLKKVKYTLSNGQSIEDDTVKVAFPKS